MGKQTHNWSALRTEFISGPINSTAEFARVMGIPLNTIKKHAKGWLKDQELFRNEVDTRIEADASDDLVLSARKRKAHLSSYITGAVEHWKELRDKLAKVEKDMKDSPSSMRMLQELRKAYVSETKILPDLLRAMELLDGGATTRTDTVIGGKHTKDMSYEELEEAEKEEALRILERDNDK